MISAASHVQWVVSANRLWRALPLLLGLPGSGLSSPLLAQCPDGSPPPCNVPTRAPAISPNSVAVLYFENLSRDSADVHLSDGLTEEVTSRLGDLAQLQVKRPNRTAVRRLQRSEEHTAELQSRLQLVCRLLLEKKNRS